jgi:hypothetical protein
MERFKCQNDTFNMWIFRLSSSKELTARKSENLSITHAIIWPTAVAYLPFAGHPILVELSPHLAIRL